MMWTTDSPVYAIPLGCIVAVLIALFAAEGVVIFSDGEIFLPGEEALKNAVVVAVALLAVFASIWKWGRRLLLFPAAPMALHILVSIY